jgi:NDP-mannose synthase
MSAGTSKMPRAIILAGGKGTRLKPFTASFPKPLVPIGDVPILEILLTKLKNAGITDITLTLGHLAELIQAYLSQRPQLMDGLTVRYVRESEPTGTAGSLSLVDGLTDTFFVINGDVLTSLNLARMLDFHRHQNAALTVAAHRIESRCEFGVIQTGEDGSVNAYVEKPVRTDFVSMGIYLYEPQVLQHIEPGKYLDFPTLVNRLLAAGQRVAAFEEPCRWLDIGRPEEYAEAQRAWEADEIGAFTAAGL